MFFFLSAFQMNNINRQIIVQPKILNSNASSVSPVIPTTETIDDMQFYSRPAKKILPINVQTSLNSTVSNPSENVNVVFRAPVVSSSSNQSNHQMRPPPPPPPKIKNSEEPSSSIPDLGKFYTAFFTFITIFSIIYLNFVSHFHNIHSMIQ